MTTTQVRFPPEVEALPSEFAGLLLRHMKGNDEMYRDQIQIEDGSLKIHKVTLTTRTMAEILIFALRNSTTTLPSFSRSLSLPAPDCTLHWPSFIPPRTDWVPFVLRQSRTSNMGFYAQALEFCGRISYMAISSQTYTRKH